MTVRVAQRSHEQGSPVQLAGVGGLGWQYLGMRGGWDPASQETHPEHGVGDSEIRAGGDLTGLS